MNTYILSPEQFLENYNQLATHIQSALEHGTGKTTIIDITQKILNQQAQCWVTLKEESIANVSVTEPIHWEGDKVMHLITTTAVDSGFDSFKEAHHELEKFSKEIGCSRVVFWGRPGWAKRLKSFEGLNSNYKQAYVVMSLDLGN